MMQRWRLVLAIIGIAVALIALAALAYAAWPLGALREQYRPEPAPVAPPAAAPAALLGGLAPHGLAP